jgi:hypothetical protein
VLALQPCLPITHPRGEEELDEMVKPPESWPPVIANRILGGAVVPLLAAEGQNIGTLTRLAQSR